MIAASISALFNNMIEFVLDKSNMRRFYVLPCTWYYVIICIKLIDHYFKIILISTSNVITKTDVNKEMLRIVHWCRYTYDGPGSSSIIVFYILFNEVYSGRSFHFNHISFVLIVFLIRIITKKHIRVKEEKIQNSQNMNVVMFTV